MRVFFDTEFIDLGDRIHLISLGAVREDGEEFYGEREACPLDLGGSWVRDNVYPLLTGPKMSDYEMRQQFIRFCGSNPEFWAYYQTYDAMLLFQLYGDFMNFPWNQVVHDINTAALLHGVRRSTFPPQTTPEHHALNDAKWNRDVYNFIMTRCPVPTAS